MSSASTQSMYAGSDVGSSDLDAAPARTMRVCDESSGLQRRSVGGEGDHVAELQVGDGGLHQLRASSGARPVLEVPHLAHDVAGRAAGYGRHIIFTAQAGAVAGGAGDGDFIAAGGGQRLAFRDGSWRDVSDETRS